MKPQIIILLACCLGSILSAQAQNNSIFSGGSSHGFDSNPFSQKQNQDIFDGGLDEGSHLTRYTQPQNQDIFHGGSDEGSSQTYFTMPQNNQIFGGGSDEGSSQDIYCLPQNNRIFFGGSDDGVSYTVHSQRQNNNLFAGGSDDGADNYRAEGLPAMFNPGFAVELLSFEAWPEGEVVQLQWATTSEVNHDYFLVERSQNLNEIDKLGRVEGKGGPQHVQPYNMTDVTPYPGRSYYRLQSVDLNGEAEASSWVEVMFEARTELAVSLYPNPTSDLITIRLAGEIAGDLEFRVFDLMGRDVGIKQSFQNVENKVEGSLNLSSLSVGIYVLQITHTHKGIIGAYRIQVRR
ncbi:MAG: T9SS type A sorting domain-containing protein [Bacteroidota bacterium]